MPSQKLNAEIIQAAIDGFVAQKSRIDGQIAELRNMLSGNSPETPAEPQQQKTPGRKKRRLSAAGRQRIIEATKKRWAAVRAAAEKSKKSSAA